jgi:NAD(P)H-flavin reductase
MSPIVLENSSKEYQLKILSSELVTHETLRIIFELPSPEHRLGVKSGQHVYLIINVKNRKIRRKYTPLDLEDHKGTCEMVIKVK